ncbi:hypothetical protein ACTU6V_08480 [Microbacterium sp. A204]|uniref:hypothetical protein n=1 Tax=Microbacterium sp. A204 TaxID=3457321 RepID=UPI003FD5D06C
MSTEALLRNTIHPPCSQEQETLEITVPADRKQLNIADRLSLRLGLWLMLRTQRSARNRRTMMSREEAARLLDAQRPGGLTHFTEREKVAILTYDMQRHML